MRASDADRDRVAEVLREAYAEGRLDAAEHTERIESAYNAKTLGELAPLLADLPQRSTGPGVTPVGNVTSPVEYGDSAGAKVMAVFGEAKRTGRCSSAAPVSASRSRRTRSRASARSRPTTPTRWSAAC